SNWSYGSTNTPVENYASFYETNELLFDKGLLPETEIKFESGLTFSTNRLSFEIAYFDNRTKDFIAPAQNDELYALKNIATIRNYGGTVSAGYGGWILHGGWGTDLHWSKYNIVVDELYGTNAKIALAGFESIQSVLVEGKPLGAIYGTTYMTNAEGQRIIGEDGFPLEDERLRMIGNPIPDFVLDWSAYVNWRDFGFSFLFDFKH